MNLIFGLFFVELTIEFELFLFFFAGRRKTEDLKQNRLINILGIYFLFIAIGRGILIYYDFYASTIVFFYNLGTGISLLGMAFLVYLAETIIPKNTHYLFTILSCATLASIFFVPLETAKYILYIMLPTVFMIIFLFFGYLIRKTSGSVRYNFILVLFGQFLFGAGQVVNTDIVSNWFLTVVGFNIRLIGLMAIIGGLALMALAFWRLPSFNELEWHSKLLQLFVITNSHSICCVHYTFKESVAEDKKNIDSDLLSSGVAGMSSFIKEITSSKMHLREVDHGDIKILFEYGQYITIALLAEETLQIYSHKLNKFMKHFETEFKKNLVNWTGSISEFRPSINIINRIFEQKVNKKESSS
ncbi:MAG: hypothetical protein ACFFD2_04840 [Promethearchaeota archaeon]